ncbi:aspartate/glutamate racemase family protein [Actinomadura geliboluensis]|uniref:aspartate/glutamate racemase family protein n=1 Tax=Actinomadura geliboluensis TaxID=882440 RepID=UPI003713F6C4
MHVLPVPATADARAAFAAQLPAEIIDPDVQVEFVAPAHGPRNMIDSPYERTIADSAVLAEGTRAAKRGADAIVINSMSDSGLNALRSRLSIPVVGVCQASMALAMQLGRSIGVITMWRPWHELYTSAAAAAGISDRLVSIRDIATRPDSEALLTGREDTVCPQLLAACRVAIKDDRADVLILGSTTLHRAWRYLSERVDVPLINPGVAGHLAAQDLLRAHLTHSRRAYPAPQRADDDLLSSFATDEP